MYLREGIAAAHRRRPISFYLLLTMPFALIFAAGLLDRSDIKQFALGLCLLFVFFGLVMMRAVADVFDITRSHIRAQRATFRATLGDADFTATLSEQAKKAQGE
jgi:hypothetical protein